MRPVTILVVGLVASGTTALLVYRAVQTRVVVQHAAPQTGTLQVRSVVVAATEVPFGSTLLAEHLKVVDWPANALPQNNFAARENVIGRLALSRLVVNEPVTNDKLAPTGSRGLLPLVIDSGMRAVTVKVNEVAAVGGFIAAGSRVDVLVTAEVKAPPPPPIGPNGVPAGATASDERHTRTLLQDVTVLAMGQLLDASGQPKPGDPITTSTLLVTPVQAEQLALGAIEGTLQLVLRNFEDHAIVASPGTRAHDLFESQLRLASADTKAVEVILGGQRFTLTF